MNYKLRALMQAQIDAGAKQIHLANEIGISASTIQKILYTNTKQDLITLQKCAVYFKKPLSELIANTSNGADLTLSEPGLQAVDIQLQPLFTKIIDYFLSHPDKGFKISRIEKMVDVIFMPDNQEEADILAKKEKEARQKRT